MAALAQVDPLETTARELITHVRLPEGVRLHRIVFDSDWSGDPATNVFYGVSESIPLTKPRVRQLTELSVATESALDNIRANGSVYVFFEDVE